MKPHTRPRRILVVSAGFDHQVNELAAVWQQLTEHYDVDVCVLALATDRLKSHQHAGGMQQFGRLSVHWLDQPYPLGWSPAVAALARAFRPDTVFAGPRDHLDVALQIAAETGARCALHVEYFFADTHWLRRREYLGVRALRRGAGWLTRRDVLARVDRVFISDPLEQSAFAGHPALRYLPWPHLPPPPLPGVPPAGAPPAGAPPAGAPLPGAPGADPAAIELVYVGSLFRAKGAARLARYLSAAARALPQLRLEVIGPAVDAEGERAIADLQAAGGERFSWTRSLPRAQALARIAAATCIVSPGHSHGWGLIGDAWHLGVPIIAAHAHYELQDGINCRIAPDPQAFVAAVRAVAEDKALRERLVHGGRLAVARHSLARSVEALATGLDLPH